MAFRDKLVAAAGPYLEPGEQVQAVLVGHSVSPNWAVISAYIMFIKGAFRAVVVTDRRILVIRTSRLGYTKFKGLDAVVDRRTLFGEPDGLVWFTRALGMKLWINKRFHKDVRAADAMAPASSGAPTPMQSSPPSPPPPPSRRLLPPPPPTLPPPSA